jgi:hypothetical protein
MNRIDRRRWAILGFAAGLAAAPAFAAPPLDAASARAFVQSVYAHYKGADALNWQPMSEGSAPGLFEPSLVKLIATTAASGSEDEVGPLDFDPLCACQDPQGLQASVVVDKVEGETAKAVAVVRFPDAPQDQPRTIRYDLVAVKGQWRIADLHEDDLPSLRALLAAPPKP